ncbi:MAG TPA: M23 family metallopeptidase [Egibacteraceae bacterium]|nr:M23 family metallopeptidase [Egibacteraceae bacterium]
MRTPDMRTLGHLGDTVQIPSRRPRLFSRRGAGRHGRRRLPPPLAAALGAVLLLALWLALAARSQTLDDSQPGVAVPAPAEAPVPARPGSAERAARDARRGGPAVFAEFDGFPLGLPHPSPVLVAFHESDNPEAVALTPVGRLAGNDNPVRFRPGPDTVGPAYHVLASQGRPRPATSAADVVVAASDWVGAPVDGRVVEAREYVLYGSLRDWRIVIEPDERPDLHVLLVHLYRPAVDAGDRVRAGTPLGRARLLPVDSPVDRVAGRRLPHVHLQVTAATDLDLVDPNEPALPADPSTDGA